MFSSPRFEFKHVEGLVDDKPGIDARELYTNRERLAELAASAPPPEEKDENKDEKSDETDKSAEGSTDDKKEKSTDDKTVKSEKLGEDSKKPSTDKPLDEKQDKTTTDTEAADKKESKDDAPRRDVLSDEYVPTGPDLSKEDHDQALRELKILYEFLIKEFENVQQRVEKLKADGLISWRMLWTLFRHDQRIETIHASSGEKIAFVMDNWDYTSDDDGKM